MADKTRNLKTQQQKSQAKHPAYMEMIQDALTNLKQARGSARQTILKYICDKYAIKDKETAKGRMNTALNTGVKKGLLKQIKGRGAYAVFKLGEKNKTPVTKTSKRKEPVQKNVGLGSTATKSDKKTTPGPRKRSLKNGRKLEEEKIMKEDVCEEAALDKEEISLERPVSQPTQERRAFQENFTNLTDIQITRNDPLYVRLSDDEKDCEIRGLDSTPDGRLLVADSKNKKIKMFDQEGRFLASHLFSKLFGGETHISVVNNEEVIVHITENAGRVLYILDIRGNELSIKDEIQHENKGMVSSMAAFQDKVVVVQADFFGIAVKLVDRRGQVHWSISRQGLFDLPQFCRSFQINNKLVIIVTDSRKKTITKLDGETGDILNICDDDDALFGVSADNNRGILYVCKRNKRQVCAWSADLSNHRTLLTHSDGLCDFPRCLTFSSPNSQLLISSEIGNNGSNYVDRYQLAYT